MNIIKKKHILRKIYFTTNTNHKIDLFSIEYITEYITIVIKLIIQ